MRDGREESRITVGGVGQLESLGKPHDSECAQFENISEHGARLLSRRPWQSGDRLLISSRFPPFSSTAANVVYCEALRDGLYAIGCRSTKGGILRLLKQREASRPEDTQVSEYSADSMNFGKPVYSMF